MMIKMQNLLIFLFLTFSFEVIVLNAKVFDTSHMLLARQKRTLIFQPGLNWIQVINKFRHICYVNLMLIYMLVDDRWYRFTR